MADLSALREHVQDALLAALILPAAAEAQRRAESLPLVLRASSGFVYCVAITGITGTRSADPAALAAEIQQRYETPLRQIFEEGNT